MVQIKDHIWTKKVFFSGHTVKEVVVIGGLKTICDLIGEA